MTTRPFIRGTFAVFATLATICTQACGAGNSRASDTPSPAPTMASSTLSDIDAFAKNPNETTEEALHADAIGPQFSADALSRIVKVVAREDVPRRALNELAADLANNDFGGTVKWLRMTNVANRTDSSPEGRLAVERTALFAWMLMALRASFDTNFVDLGGMDLRVSEPFVGRSMNFFNVSFAQTTLSGGVWRDSNLGATRFDQAISEGRLRCESCSWGSLHTKDTAQLANGGWILVSDNE